MPKDLSDLPLEPWRRPIPVATVPRPPRRDPETPLADTNTIANGIDNLIAARVLLHRANDIKEGKMPPLIEIKGLGNMVADARRSIAEVKSEGAGLTTDAAAFVTAVKDVRGQIQQAHADLKFEAEMLGNGGETSSGSGSGTGAK